MSGLCFVFTLAIQSPCTSAFALFHSHLGKLRNAVFATDCFLLLRMFLNELAYNAGTEGSWPLFINLDNVLSNAFLKCTKYKVHASLHSYG